LTFGTATVANECTLVFSHFAAMNGIPCSATESFVAEIIDFLPEGVPFLAAPLVASRRAL